MPKLATTHSLNDYPRLAVSQYKEHLRQSPTTPKAVTLSYGYRGKQHRYDVAVTTTVCNYGSHRYWWLCPKCERRVSVLYCAGSYVCRHCIGANYHTQLQQPLDRQFKRIAELRQRLGWHGGLAHGMGDRPRYMHKQTYQRLEHEYIITAKKVLNMTLKTLPKGL